MKKKIRSKTFVFSVRLKGVGPESRKKLMGIGLDKDLTIGEYEVEFKDFKNWGFKHPCALMALDEKRVELLNQHVECVVREKKPRKGAGRGCR